MNAKIINFPSTPVLRAVRQLQRPVSPEAEMMAASVVIEALVAGEPVPPGTLNIVCSMLVRTARTTFGIRLAGRLAVLDFRVEILALGGLLLENPATRAAGMALLRRLG